MLDYLKPKKKKNLKLKINYANYNFRSFHVHFLSLPLSLSDIKNSFIYLDSHFNLHKKQLKQEEKKQIKATDGWRRGFK